MTLCPGRWLFGEGADHRADPSYALSWHTCVRERGHAGPCRCACGAHCEHGDILTTKWPRS